MESLVLAGSGGGNWSSSEAVESVVTAIRQGIKNCIFSPFHRLKSFRTLYSGAWYAPLRQRWTLTLKSKGRGRGKSLNPRPRYSTLNKIKKRKHKIENNSGILRLVLSISSKLFFRLSRTDSNSILVADYNLINSWGKIFSIKKSWNRVSKKNI